ncbi:MAG: hypothetical protein ABR497_03990 [Kiritimatiellia bacterium]|nr:hypothetical protein [Lentisphaerota bacterium]
MRKACLVYCLSLGLLVGWGVREAGAQHSLLLGGRYHNEHSHFDALPFGNGDISYLLGYAYGESLGIWQLAVDFAPDVSGGRPDDEDGPRAAVDYVVTPQLNVLVKDRIFRGGVGFCTSYIRAEDDSEWLDPYWQFFLGFNFPLVGKVSLDATAAYAFEKWDRLDRFDFDDVEFNLVMNLEF